MSSRIMSLVCFLLLALTSCGDGESQQGTTRSADSKPTLMGVEAVDAFIETWSTMDGGIDKTQTNWKLILPEPNLAQFDPQKRYIWVLETSKGEMKIELMPEVAPQHVTSTIYLTRLGFYDNTSFHRIIQTFMAQGGSPTGRSTGGPGYSYDSEFQEGIHHDRRGQLSMANSGPGTDGSQFFITFSPQPGLDGKHTIFGQLIEGNSTLIKIEKQGTVGAEGTPKRPIFLKKATIVVQDK